MSNTIQIEVIHKFDGPATALLEKIVEAALIDGTYDTLGAEVGNVATGDQSGGDPTREVPGLARQPGKPSPGRARRTKAEVAEDKAAAVANGGGVTPSKPAEPKGPTLGDVRERLRPFHKAHGSEETKKLFEGLSGGSIPTIKDPADLATLIERIDAIEVAAGQSGGSTAGSFD